MPAPRPAPDIDQHELGTDATTIAVFGLGRAPIEPDRAEIGFGATATAASAAAARNDVATAMTAVLAAVRAQGVTMLRTASLSVAPRYDHRGESPLITGYEATNAVTATISDLATVGAVVDAAIGAGATTLDGPRFFAADPSAAITSARRSAVADAADRATTLAEATGLAIVGVASMSEGGPRPMPMPKGVRMMALAESVPSPVEIGIDDVQVQVEVVYLAARVTGDGAR
jgi:hypothetical protein